MNENILKLRFIYKFLDGLYLFKNENIDDHAKRNLLRYFFVLTDNLLKLIGNIKNTLFKEGQITLDQRRNFEDSINRLKNDFDKSYDIIRDRFAAHQQELELSDIIGWWNEIDIETITIFYDELNEIKELLKMYIDDFFEPIDDYSPLDFANTPLAPKDGQSFYLAHDRLALTRQNTSGMISIHETQDKAQIILSIVNLTFANFHITTVVNNRETHYKNIIFITAWLLIICDTCSLIDNLYEDIGNKYVNSISLMNLWKRESIRGHNILEKVNAEKRDHNFETELRTVRNKIGAHLDQQMTIKELLELYNAIDLQRVHNYFIFHANAFRLGCLEDIRTKIFASLDFKLNGVKEFAYSPYKKFD